MKMPAPPLPPAAETLLGEAHRLRHFVTLAEEGHYGKAAQRLGMDQPTLSRSIVRLEQALGAQLLVRTARAVSLTPAGEAFVGEARALLVQAELSTNLVRRARDGEIGSLRIGFTPTAMFWAVPEILRRLRERYPDIQIVMQEGQSYQHVKRLREGALDAAFINGDEIKKSGFETLLLERTRIVAAVPSAWPVAQTRRLRLKDLAELPFVIVSHQTSPTLHQETLAACRAAGFVPKIVPGEHTEVLSRLGMVASNFGVMLASEYTRLYPVAGVTYLPIVDLPDYLDWELVLAWDGRGATPALRALAEIGRAVARTKPRGRTAAKAGAQSGTKVDARAGTKAGVKAGVKAGAKASGKVGAKAGTKVAAKAPARYR